jgi:hypothetical protein
LASRRESAGATILDPALRTRADLRLLLLTLAAAASSILALLLDWVGWIRMPYTVSFLSLPAMVFLVVLTVWAGRTREALLFNRLTVGATGGLLGLVGYDVVRWLVQVVLPVDFDAFAAFPTFGHLMTGEPREAGIALAAGWAYHVTNGLTFGIIYALVAGPARWWWGLVWGAALEAAMMVVYPSLMNPRSVSDFVMVSVIGHGVFGAIVGVSCERRAVPAR